MLRTVSKVTSNIGYRPNSKLTVSWTHSRSHNTQCKANDEWPTLVLLGDSITQKSFSEGGWGAMLADSLQRKCDVINRGFNGYTTSTAMRFRKSIFDKKTFSNLVGAVIFFGTNDSALPGAYHHGHVTLKQYKANLSSLVQEFARFGLHQQQIVLVSPPPADVRTWRVEKQLQGYDGEEDRKNSITVEYAAACRQVAKQHDCRFVDLWDIINNRRDISIYFSDGLHLSKLGSKVLYDALLPHVAEITKQLPVKLPEWTDLD